MFHPYEEIGDNGVILQPKEWRRTRKTLRILAIPVLIHCCLAFFEYAVIQTTYFSELRGHLAFACAILIACLAASFLYRTRMEQDSDRPKMPVVVTSALLVYLALVLEVSAIIYAGQLSRAHRR
jgi:uncharacterized membrane protein